jgi:DNA topoisomerase-1
VDTEEQLLTVTVDEAVKILAEPKKFGRRKAAPAPPLKELGNDIVSEKPMVVKDGRFGPYVTDGETNASLRKGDTIENITPERAMELLQIRRDAGPAKKARKGAKKAPAKKAAKKATKKTATRKAPAKKAAATPAAEPAPPPAEP